MDNEIKNACGFLLGIFIFFSFAVIQLLIVNGENNLALVITTMNGYMAIALISYIIYRSVKSKTPTP